MNYLPHRHSDKSVRRFVPTLVALVVNHQQAGTCGVEFDPTTLGLSVNTAIARLRDAVHAITHGLTTYPNLDPDILSAIWKGYRIDSDGVKIQIRPTKLESDTQSVRLGALDVLDATLPQFAEIITAYAVLFSYRRQQGEITINGELDPKLQQQLEATYDIVISQTGFNQHTML